MRTRKAERVQRKLSQTTTNNLKHDESPLMQAFDDFKAGVPGSHERICDLLGCQKRPGRRSHVKGEEV